ncbi:hypothetical protein HPP92_008083 [Vanilla planifolia]|uniref:Uncharacterized protein n=1 Tax=Vanilla planifolia TaxID=51239 RepID=A0A835RE44_VANPL|nr:hypothetical protein HPP92_008250 [Vanilla planifolia]KAG0491220.1 hypothetical protein HPP92_008083 [Vanilla planifolia]
MVTDPQSAGHDPGHEVTVTVRVTVRARGDAVNDRDRDHAVRGRWSPVRRSRSRSRSRSQSLITQCWSLIAVTPVTVLITDHSHPSHPSRIRSP